jgi:hypothetical protein
MGYATFKEAPKPLTKSENIGAGQIELSHLSPALFVELRQVALHTHTGTRSRRVNMKDLTGAFTSQGFYMYSSDATKKYQVTINSATNAFVLTQV